MDFDKIKETAKKLSQRKSVRAAAGLTAAGILTAAVMANSDFTKISFNPDQYSRAPETDDNDIIFDGVVYSAAQDDADKDSLSRKKENEQENPEDDVYEENDNDTENLLRSENLPVAAPDSQLTVGRISDDADAPNAHIDALAGFDAATGSGGSGSVPVIARDEDGGSVPSNAANNNGEPISPYSNAADGGSETNAAPEAPNGSPSGSGSNAALDAPKGDAPAVSEPEPNVPEAPSHEYIPEAPPEISYNLEPSPEPAPTASAKVSGGGSGVNANRPIVSENTNPSGSTVTPPPKNPQPSEPEESDPSGGSAGGSTHGVNSGEAVGIEIYGDFSELCRGASEAAVFSAQSGRSVRLLFENGDYMTLVGAQGRAAGVSLSGFDTSSEKNSAKAYVSYVYNSKTYRAEFSYGVKQWTMRLYGLNGELLVDNLIPNSELSVNLSRYYSAMRASNPQFCGWNENGGSEIYTSLCVMDKPLMELYSCTELNTVPSGGKTSALTVPEGFNKVDFSACGVYPQVESIEIPAGVHSIVLDNMAEVFPNLKSVSVAEGNAVYQSVDGALYMGNSLVYVPPMKTEIKEYKEGVSSIGARAFENSRISETVLPDTVADIGEEAFLNASIDTLTISAENYSVSRRAFFSENDVPAVSRIISLALYTARAREGALDFGVSMPVITLPDSVSDIIYQRYLAQWGVSINAKYGAGTAQSVLVTQTKAESRNTLIGNAVYSFFDSPDRFTLACVNESAEGSFYADSRMVKIASGAFDGCGKITGVILGNTSCAFESGCFGGMNALTALSVSCAPTEIDGGVFDGVDITSFKIYVPSEYLEAYLKKWGAVIDSSFGEGTAEKVIFAADESMTVIDGAWYLKSENSLTLLRVPLTLSGCFTPASGTTKIAAEAFPAEISLDSLIIPETVELIDPNAVCDGADIGYVFINSKAALDASAFAGGKIFVPASARSGYGSDDNIFSCSESYFADENNIIFGEDILAHVPSYFSGALEIPDGIRSVYDGAAADCRKITRVSFGKDAIEIGANAFYNCTLLSDADFGSAQIENIDERAFYGCVSLKNASLPSSLAAIGAEAFERCDALSFVVFGDAPRLSSIGDRAFALCNSLVGFNAEASVDLKSLTELSSLGARAFSECPLISQAALPETAEIPDGMFDGCISLKTVSGWEKPFVIGAAAFRGTAVRMIDMTDSNISVIKENAFADCPELDVIFLGDKLKELDPNFAQDGAEIIFAVKKNAPSVTADTAAKLLENKKIYDTIFTVSENSEAIERIFTGADARPFDGGYYYDEAKGGLYVITKGEGSKAECTLLKAGIKADVFDMTLQRVVTAVDADAFRGCSRLTDITWNRSVSYIPPYIFSGLSSLRSFTFRSVGGFTNSVTVGEGAFKDCSSLKAATLPNYVSFVGAEAFYSCVSLNEVNWYATAYVEDSVFFGCEALESFNLSAQSVTAVTSIGAHAFDGCRSLVKIMGFDDIQFERLEEIGENAFKDCSSILSLKLPVSLKRIGRRAFDGCVSLGRITLGGDIELIGEMVFGDDPGESYFYTTSAAFRERWSERLAADYGSDAPERLIQGIPEPEESQSPEPSLIPEESPLPEETSLPEETPIPEISPVPEETPVPEEAPSPEVTSPHESEDGSDTEEPAQNDGELYQISPVSFEEIYSARVSGDIWNKLRKDAKS